MEDRSPRYPEAMLNRERLSGECTFLGHFNGHDLYFAKENGSEITALVSREDQLTPDIRFVRMPLKIGPEGEAHHVARFLATRLGYLAVRDFAW